MSILRAIPSAFAVAKSSGRFGRIRLAGRLMRWRDKGPTPARPSRRRMARASAHATGPAGAVRQPRPGLIELAIMKPSPNSVGSSHTGMVRNGTNRPSQMTGAR